MSDRDIESTLDRSLPETTPAALDQRILEAARGELTARRPPNGRRWRWAIAASLLLVVGAAALWQALDAGDDGPIRLADGGTLRLAEGSRHELRRSLSRLELFRGAVQAETGSGSLQIVFPRGRLRLASGRAEVRVAVKGDPEMSRLTRRLGIGGIAAGTLAAIVSIQLFNGDATLEVDGRGDPIELEAPRSLELAVPEGEEEPVEVLEPDLEVSAQPVERTDEAPEVTDAPPTEEAEAPFLFGRIVRAGSGEPIPGAEVLWCLHRETGLRIHRETRTDGSFSISYGLAAEPLPVVAEGALEELGGTTTDADGRFVFQERPAYHTEGLLLRAEGARPVLIPGIPNSLEGDERRYELSPGGQLSGRLLAADGGPVEGGSLFAALEMGIVLQKGDPHEELQAEVPLDENGQFRLFGDIGTRVELRVTAEGYRPVEREVQIRPGRQHVDIVLEATDFISGHVRDTRGQPIKAAWVEVTSVKRRLFFEEAKRSTRVQTTSDGFFRVGVVGPDIELIAEHEDFATVELDDVELNRSDLEILLPPVEKGALSGRVVHADGSPAPGVKVIVYREGAVDLKAIETRTGRGDEVSGEGEGEGEEPRRPGHFRFDDLRTGTYDLTVRRNERGELTRPEDGTLASFIDTSIEGVEVRSGEETTGIEVVLPVGGTIVGQFFDDEGNPTANTVSLYEPDLIGGDHEMLEFSQTDEQGRYNFSGVPAGTYAVTRGFGSEIKLVKVVEGETVEVNFGGRRGQVEGRVLFEDEPVDGAQVSVGIIGSGTIESREVTTTKDGRFVARQLSLGTCLARIVHPELDQTIWVEVLAEETPGEQVIHWPQGRIFGRVDGEALPSDVPIQVSLVSVAGEQLEGKIPPDYLHIATVGSGDGHTFEVRHLAPGVYRVSAEHAGRRLEGTCDLFGESATVVLQPKRW